MTPLISELDLADKLPVPDSIRLIADSTDRRLGWLFFVFFSRFEYALKRDIRYLMPGIGGAKPDWDQFAYDHNMEFQSDLSPALTKAIKYFESHPPRKQIRTPSGMGWSEPAVYDGQEPLLKWVLCMVRRVRNNLFHGGKFPLIPIPDASRDCELLINAMTILKACLALDEKIEQLIEEGVDV